MPEASKVSNLQSRDFNTGDATTTPTRSQNSSRLYRGSSDEQRQWMAVEMSPSILGPDHQAFGAEDEATALSDEDVQLLFEIITQAERSPGPQFGPGLFAAYDEILARENVPSSLEQKYFMFLLRMLTGRGENDSLFSRFEHVLGEIGIQVERRDGFQPENAEVRDRL